MMKVKILLVALVAIGVYASVKITEKSNVSKMVEVSSLEGVSVLADIIPPIVVPPPTKGNGMRDENGRA